MKKLLLIITLIAITIVAVIMMTNTKEKLNVYLPLDLSCDYALTEMLVLPCGVPGRWPQAKISYDRNPDDDTVACICEDKSGLVIASLYEEKISINTLFISTMLGYTAPSKLTCEADLKIKLETFDTFRQVIKLLKNSNAFYDLHWKITYPLFDQDPEEHVTYGVYYVACNRDPNKGLAIYEIVWDCTQVKNSDKYRVEHRTTYKGSVPDPGYKKTLTDLFITLDSPLVLKEKGIRSILVTKVKRKSHDSVLELTYEENNSF